MTVARSRRGRGSVPGGDPARGPTSSRAAPLPHPRSREVEDTYFDMPWDSGGPRGLLGDLARPGAVGSLDPRSGVGSSTSSQNRGEPRVRRPTLAGIPKKLPTGACLRESPGPRRRPPWASDTARWPPPARVAALPVSLSSGRPWPRTTSMSCHEILGHPLPSAFIVASLAANRAARDSTGWGRLAA
jgi:hypothetical protein